MARTGALHFTCPTCKAGVGQPCDKRGNTHRGGPHHLARVDRYLRAVHRGEDPGEYDPNHSQIGDTRMTPQFNDFPGFRGGKIPPEVKEMQRAVNEMVARQVKARNDLIERVLLRSLTGTCGVLVTDDPDSGDVTAVVDERIPYATVVYVPAQRVFDELDPALLEPAPVQNLHMLLRHLAKKLAEVGAS